MIFKNKTAYRILKIIWILVGTFILLVTFLLYLKMYSSTSGFGVIAVVLLVAVCLKIFMIYLGITIVFLIVKWIIKKLGRKNKNKVKLK